jgi:hypothetical protein
VLGRLITDDQRTPQWRHQEQGVGIHRQPDVWGSRS